MDEDGRSSVMSPRAQKLKEELLGEFSLTVDDVAGILEVDRSTVYRYIQDGALAALKIGREYRLSDVDVRGFLEALIARERQRVSELRLKALSLTPAPPAVPAAAPRETASAPPPAPVAEPGPDEGGEPGDSDWGEVVVAAWSQAVEEARARGQEQTHPAHVLLALASDAPYRRWYAVFRGEGRFGDSLARQALERLSVDLPALRAAAEAALPPPALPPGEGVPRHEDSTALQELSRELMPAAQESLGRRWIGTDAVLLGLYGMPETAQALRAAGAEEPAVRAELQRFTANLARTPAAPPFARRARNTVHRALDLALQGRSPVVTPEHLLLALTSDEAVAREGIARRVLDDVHADLPLLRRAVQARLPAPAEDAEGTPTRDPEPGAGLRAVVLERAVAAARGLDHDHVGTEHLLLGLYSIPELADLLEGAGAPHARVRSRLRRLLPPRAPQPDERQAMFGRYSERAQKAIVVAQDEVRRRGRDHVTSEDLFLALLSDAVGGIARRSLEELAVDIGALRAALEVALPPPREAPGKELRFTPGAKAVIMEHATEAARGLGHRYVGTEHLLLGLYAEGKHAELLEGGGALREAVEARILQLLGGAPGADPGPALGAAAQAVVRQAEEEARRLGIPAVHAGHILLGLVSDVPEIRGSGARDILDRLDVDVEALRSRVAGTLPAAAGAPRRSRGTVVLTTDGQAAVSRHAPAAARAVQAGQVGTQHLLLGLYQSPDLAGILTAAGAPEDAVRVEVARMAGLQPPAGPAEPGASAGPAAGA